MLIHVIIQWDVTTFLKRIVGEVEVLGASWLVNEVLDDGRTHYDDNRTVDGKNLANLSQVLSDLGFEVLRGNDVYVCSDIAKQSPSLL